MQLYLDTSALVKIVVAERESPVLRAVVRTGSFDAVAHARRVLSRLDTVTATHRLLDEAGSLGPPWLRTLDAIHLAAALTAPALRAFVTYDSRLAQAAESIGITVVAPR